MRAKVLTAYAMAAVSLGGAVSLLALVSGAWFPVTDGFLHDLGQVLPSYWLVQAGRISIHGHGWGTTGWTVVLAWTVALTLLAGFAYIRDTGRV
jgi:ABC-2 type transport system permease protein